MEKKQGQPNHSFEPFTELPPDSDKLEFAPEIVSFDSRKAVTFPLRWRLYSLVFFLVIGTSIAFLLVPLILLTVLLIFIDVPTEQVGVVFYIGAVSTMLWFGYRVFRDFRQKISFHPSGIILRTQGVKETFTWNRIRHIELLHRLIVIQFSTTAVLIRPTTQKQDRLLFLINRYHPITTTTPKKGHILHDLRGSHSKPIGFIIPYGLAGLGIGTAMAAVFSEGFSLSLFFTYLVGYLIVGGMYANASQNEGAILTTKGVMDVSIHKQTLQASVPQSVSKKRPIPWLPWLDINHFEIYHDSMVLQSELGRLEVIGGKEVVDLILNQIDFDPTQWSLTKIPIKQIQYPRKVGIRIGLLKTYQVVQYSATFGDKKVT